MPLEAGRVDLWYARPQRAADLGLLDRWRGLLSDDEQARHRRFLFEKDRHRFLVTRALVRSVLSAYAGGDPRAWVFTANVYGRPEVLRPAVGPWRFNLSHTDGLVMCAVSSSGDLGVDVERIEAGRARLELARRFFASSESDALGRLDGARRVEAFYEFWTLKESYIKARGMGLAIPLSSFAFELSPGSAPGLACGAACGDRPAGWQFGRLRLFGTHQAAVALRVEPGAPLALTIRETIPLEWRSEALALPPEAANWWTVEEGGLGIRD